ncbi:oxysterol-binding protein-related protein 10-like [Colossoma macropomum]|uniref:oxysterol-binding protein-related protein 10-like n=1 Tax=Colossoma macropomum TaxID=42526 RepID=UPI0018644736|nr:oxysterol-binding protein-related protein 10-like [Colossoma macropomum]
MEKTLHAGLEKASWARRTARSVQSSAPGSGSGSGSGSGPGSGSGSPGQGSMGRRGKAQLEGVLSKYTNLLQGWQNRYFVLDPELSQLQYFVNEQGRSQKPRGTLPLIGASVTPSDEAPHMFIVSSANGELFKLRAVDSREQQMWMSQLQACSRRLSDCSAKVKKLKDSDEHLCVDRSTSNLDTQGRVCSFSLLPSSSSSSSPGVQRHHPAAPSNIITITHTHHKSPAAARRSRTPYPHTLLEVKEVMSQAEARQKTLVQSIEGLPRRGSVSCLDQDLLLLKATSAATLSCLGECLSILQHSHTHSHAHNQAPASDGAHVWTVPKSPSAECVRNGGVAAMHSTEHSTEPSPSLRKKGPAHNAEVLQALLSHCCWALFCCAHMLTLKNLILVRSTAACRRVNVAMVTASAVTRIQICTRSIL